MVKKLAFLIIQEYGHFTRMQYQKYQTNRNARMMLELFKATG